MWRDIRFGIRLWRKHPAPVGIAIVGLGLAIGVVTTAFSLLNATRLRPYGMDDPHGVVQVTTTAFAHRYAPTWSYNRFLTMQQATSLAAVGAFVNEQARISRRPDEAEVARSAITFVSGAFLPMLGGRTILGRSLGPADDLPEAAPVVLLSHRLWTTHFDAAPDIIGTTVWVNGSSATVVGVMRPDFSMPTYRQPQAWASFAAFDDLLGVAQTYTVNGRIPVSRQGEPFHPTARTDVDVLARLKPGVSTSAAEAELSSLVNAPALHGPTPPAQPLPVRLFEAATPMDGPDAAESWLELGSLLGLVGLVLMVAFANAANLLLASTATRAREIGVRLALGATRRRLWGQMVVESLLMGVSATVIGVLLAAWLAPSMAGLIALDPGIDVAPDSRVLLFALGVALCCGLVAAVGPSRFGAGGHVLQAIQAQGLFGSRGKESSLVRSSFVALQAAVSILLLISAALLGRTAIRNAHTDVGFDANRTLAVEVTTPAAGLDEPVYFRRALDLLAATPAVEAVGLIEPRPFGFSRESMARSPFRIAVHRTDAGFFQAAGVRLSRGRLFTDADVLTEQPVALITESVARYAFGDADPIGRPLSDVAPGTNVQPATIVGVVNDVTLNRQDTRGAGIVFRPLRRGDAALKTSPATILVRTAHPPAMARPVEQTLRGLDPRIRHWAAPLQLDVDRINADQRMLAWMAAPIALLSLILSTLGIFGVTSFVIGRRLTEMSIRMVLGATVTDVSRLLLRDSLRPVLTGLAIGVAMAAAAAKVFASLLPGISPFDPLSYVAAVLLLAAAALLAVLRPLRLTARTSPAGVLRQG